MSRIIRSSKTEMMVAAYIGCGRNVQCLFGGWKPGAGLGTDDTWTPNVEGAAGEMAVAKALNLYWLPLIGDYQSTDVGPYEVRTNMSRKHTDLNLRPKDFDRGGDDKIYISVLSFAPEFEILGWIYGRDGKQPQWFRRGTPGRPPSWWVPATALHDIETLINGVGDGTTRLPGAA